jgi:hypothetical protein
MVETGVRVCETPRRSGHDPERRDGGGVECFWLVPGGVGDHAAVPPRLTDGDGQLGIESRWLGWDPCGWWFSAWEEFFPPEGLLAVIAGDCENGAVFAGFDAKKDFLRNQAF